MSHDLIELSDAELESVSAGFFDTTNVTVNRNRTNTVNATQTANNNANGSANGIGIGLLSVASVGVGGSVTQGSVNNISNG